MICVLFKSIGRFLLFQTCLYISAYVFVHRKRPYFNTDVMACWIVCLFLLHLGVLCLLRMCGVHIRHHLPPLHPRPMVVFRCQHLRMGPVCLAHRLVQVFCADFFFLIFSASRTDTFTSKTQCSRNSQLPSFFNSTGLFSFFSLSLTFMQREESVYPLYHCGSCLCISKLPYGSKIWRTFTWTCVAPLLLTGKCEFYLFIYFVMEKNSRFFQCLFEINCLCLHLSVSAIQWWLWALALRATLATRCDWGNRRRCRRRTNSTCSFYSRLYLQSNRCCRDRSGRQRRVRRIHTNTYCAFLCNTFYCYQYSRRKSNTTDSRMGHSGNKDGCFHLTLFSLDCWYYNISPASTATKLRNH